MRRRQFLAAGLGASALAGCLGLGDSGSPGTPSTTTTATGESTTSTTTARDLRGVYVQSFSETMAMQGTAERGDYGFALMYTVPHTFWTVTLDSVEEVARTEDDSVHLMSVVWDAQTRTVLPDVGLSVEITRDGDLVSQEQIYPMLSQPMGFHYGANFSLPADGTYTATLSVSGVTARRTGDFQGRFAESASADIPLAYTDEERAKVSTQQVEQGGDPGALAPRDGPLPKARAPEEDALPGRFLGRTTSGGAVFLSTALDAPPAGVDGSAAGGGNGGGDAGSGQYLAVSARTPYNRLLLPSMTLAATLRRDGETVFDGELARTLDPDLGYHYGAAVPGVESGDELALRVETPPQVARHEGYEEAFLAMPPMELAV